MVTAVSLGVFLCLRRAPSMGGADAPAADRVGRLNCAIDGYGHNGYGHALGMNRTFGASA